MTFGIKSGGGGGFTTENLLQLLGPGGTLKFPKYICQK